MKLSVNSPLYNALAKYCKGRQISFHMPGHKAGKGLPGFFRENLASFDITEIPGMDNLHFPDGLIREAQEHAAFAFGADSTFFLVNGSTVGILGAVAAVCRPGNRLIVQRDSHRSAASALMLAGAEPVFLKVNYDELTGISLPPSTQDLVQLLSKNDDVSGVFLTRPGYYGQCGNIRDLVKIAHKWNKPVIVDEAHGAHLVFSERLPECALEAGADIVIQSAHKTLPALTQGAYLHLGKGGRVDRERLTSCLRMLQTTSPSYVIMASLDLAAGVMALNGKEMLDVLLDNIACLKKRISVSWIGVADGSNLPVHAFDDTRLVFKVREAGITGFEAERILKEKYNIQVEMSDPSNIVCIASVADDKDDLDALGNALLEIGSSKSRPRPAPKPLFDGFLPERVVPLCEVRSLLKEKIPLEQSAGRICADIITPYPPGIPAIWPGERISADMPARINEFLGQGGTINGIYPDKTIYCLK